MAFLTGTRGRGGESPLRRAAHLWRILLPLLLLVVAGTSLAQAPTSREYQLKAVFLFNFTQFAEWPAEAFETDQSPVVIGVLGQDSFGPYLDQTVRDETVKGRRLVVRRYQKLEEVKGCHLLFVSSSEHDNVQPILESVKRLPVLTVGETDDFARRGGMVQLSNEQNRIRLLINVDATKDAKLSLSSKLLRPARIVSTETEKK